MESFGLSMFLYTYPEIISLGPKWIDIPSNW